MKSHNFATPSLPKVTHTLCLGETAISEIAPEWNVCISL